MNTLPWDTDDSIDKHYSLLMSCVVVSIFLHVVLFIFFVISEPKEINKIKQHITTINIDLKTATKTIQQPKQIKPKKQSKISTEKKVKTNINKTLTTKNSKKTIQKKYSALEKKEPKIKKKKSEEKFLEKANNQLQLAKEVEVVDDQPPITTTTTNKENTINYKALLKNWLYQYKKYPIASKKKRQEDTVIVSFTIDAEGKLLSHTITKASKYRLLNKAVIKMLKRANPMPAIPKKLRGKNTQFTYSLPVDFYLQGL